ncbi:MaoC/PaaZ C-terminal domain-containing protein [Micromonospora aurantiaca]|uniref:MaoC/PaaZ C-terminal domain-containing protein n=1 Tax=Micromonospora aurantiaca (nom. illeg.) TaxID=47850 RepID=UPI001F0CB149|nr:MaoC/PaaZ C-terminal domain-containing protein [Micromonospora aurantiaca]
MAPRDHEDDDLTLHDLIEGPTRDLTAARAAAQAQSHPTQAHPSSDDHEVDGTSGDPQGSQLHDRRGEGEGEEAGPEGRRRVALSRLPASGALYRRALLGVVPGVGGRRGADVPGLELGVSGVAVDQRHLADYDRVCGFRLTDRLPATYLHVLGFPLSLRLMTGPGFPIPLTGVVHVANRITVHRPVEVGESVDFHTYAENLRPHERGRQLDVVLVGSIGGEEVWRGVSTYLGKERAAGGGPRRDRGDRPAPPAASARWRVTPRVGTDYARVSGDHNPIHTSKLGARLFGFPRPIAHGMWSKARCLAALEPRLPEAYTVDVSFKLPVPLPSTVAFSASATGEGWDFALHSARDGRPHLVGSVR